MNPVRIPVNATISLQACLNGRGGQQAAVICHPHPLYGGTMDNNVVLAARDTANELGLATLRFNFRGVGESHGTHGEGEAEVDDVLAAVRFLRETQESQQCHVIGYSFGAYVSLRAIQAGLQPATLTLISPPVNVMPVEALTLPPVPTLVITGTRDDYCDVATLQSWLNNENNCRENASIKLIEGANHFYFGDEPLMQKTLKTFLRPLL
jgi:uncharacterized protein